MCEGDTYRCATRGEAAVLGDGCRITNQSIPASEREGERKTGTVRQD